MSWMDPRWMQYTHIISRSSVNTVNNQDRLIVEGSQYDYVTSSEDREDRNHYAYIDIRGIPDIVNTFGSNSR